MYENAPSIEKPKPDLILKKWPGVKGEKVYGAVSGKRYHRESFIAAQNQLQAWYNLSDYALEEVLDERSLFQAFRRSQCFRESPGSFGIQSPQGSVDQTGNR